MHAITSSEESRWKKRHWLPKYRKHGFCHNFVGEGHTAAHMRGSYWMSKLFGRQAWYAWEESGSRQLLDKAHAYVEKVTAGYQQMAPVVNAT